MFAFHGRKGMLLIALAMLAALVASAVGLAPKTAAGAPEDNAGANGAELELTSIDEIAGKRIGVLNGAYFDKLTLDHVQGVSQGDLYYFSSNAETIGALGAGKVDAIITDSPIAQLAVNKNDGIAMLPDYMADDRYDYILEKGSDLTSKVNERLEAYRQDGTIERLKEKWTGPDESEKTMPDMPRNGANEVYIQRSLCSLRLNRGKPLVAKGRYASRRTSCTRK